MASSRLSSHLRRKAVQNVLIVFVGFIVLIVAAVIFGEKLLVNFSLMLEKTGGSNNSAQLTGQQSDTYVAPPTLNPVVDATSSAQITVSGFGIKNQTINLYLNDQQIDQTTVGNDNTFKFSSVNLQQGQNTITVKAVNSSGKQSGSSNTDTISYLKNPPLLTISSPQDGQGFDKGSTTTVSIQGTTDPGAKVTVNGFWAIVDDQGNYNYLYTLQDGDNDIKVIATDAAGNQTTKEIHIHTQ
jgi:Glucodextranase, domain B